MRNWITRAAAVAVCVFLAIGLLAGPSAAAQGEGSETREFYAEFEIQLPDGCIRTVVQILVSTLLPGEYNQPLVASSEIEETVTDECPDEDPEAVDEVLGIVEFPLASTGSTVDLPVAVGFSLIGAGGLALLAARKRQDRSR